MTEKQVWRIAVIPGDGIGQEVISEGLRILAYLAAVSNGAFAFADEVFEQVSKDYSDVETEKWLVDAIAARFVLYPQTLEVVVASNLFGDILSDLGSALAGSLGIAASANLNPTRRYPGMFEPVHGSAPDIAGRGIANPIGAIWSAALMLENLGLQEESARVLRAIEATTRAGEVTPDLGGSSTTRKVGDAVLSHLGRE